MRIALRGETYADRVLRRGVCHLYLGHEWHAGPGDRERFCARCGKVKDVGLKTAEEVLQF